MAAVAASVAVALLVLYRISQHHFELGSGAGRWTYPYIHDLDPIAGITFFLVLPYACGLTWWATRTVETQERLCLAAWWAAALPLQLVLRYPYPHSFDRLIRSDLANSFYSPTLKYSAFRFLHDFRAIATSLPLHASTNMPGKVLLFFLLRLFTDNPQTMGYLILALSNLGGVLVYYIVKEQVQQRRAALFAMVLYLFIPGKLYFFPILNTVAPVLMLLCLFFHLRFLASGRAAYGLALGAGLYGLLCFEPLPLVTGIVFAVLSIHALVQRHATLLRVAKSLALAIGGFLAVHALVRLFVGFDVFGCFLYMLEDARKFNERDNRPYAIWVVQNLIDFALCAGIANALLALGAVVDALRGPSRFLPTVVLGVATLATLAFLDLVGINRGEVIRLWIFVAVFFEMLAAILLARLPGVTAFCVVFAATLAQDAIGLQLIGFVMP